jgi:diguanylate cyclase (GGDEF)-like protein
MDQTVIVLERKSYDMPKILDTVRVFDNLFCIKDVCQFFSGIIKERFGLKTIALFTMGNQETKFKLLFGDGVPEELPADMFFPEKDDSLRVSIAARKPFQGTNKIKRIFPENSFFVPLIREGDMFGFFCIGQEDKNTESLTEEGLEFIAMLAERAAVSLTTAILHEKTEADRRELDKTIKNLSILYNTGRAMIEINDLKNLLKFILNQAIKTMNAQKGSLMLYDQQTERLEVRVVRGLPDEKIEEAINSGEKSCATFAVGEGIAGKVFGAKEPIIVNSTQTDKRYTQSEGSNVESIICLPLVASEEAIGVINITNKIGEEQFTPEDLDLLTALGNLAAVAINNARLQELAVTDELTSLYVRRYFNVKLDAEIKRAKRYNSELSLAICDLDHFKLVNDTYGHQMGDIVLKSVAVILKSTVREIDSPTRYGGEEFAIIFPETDIDGASAVCERIRGKIEKMVVQGLPRKISISIGLAIFPLHADDSPGLIQAADTALYQAKSQGRNRIYRYNSQQEKTNFGLWGRKKDFYQGLQTNLPGDGFSTGSSPALCNFFPVHMTTGTYRIKK